MPNSELNRDCWFSSLVKPPGKQEFHEIAQSNGIARIEASSPHDYGILNAKFPGHLVVIELLSETSSPVEEMNEQISHIRTLGNLPTIFCIGNRVPIDQVVDWMRSGMFAYADFDTPASRIEKLLVEALEVADAVGARFERFQVLDSHWNDLTLPERSVLDMILEGIPNKTIATKLGVSQRTIEARRQRLYQKMGCKSLPGVVQSIFEWKHLKEQFGELAYSPAWQENSKSNRANMLDSEQINKRILTERMVANYPTAGYSDVSSVS